MCVCVCVCVDNQFTDLQDVAPGDLGQTGEEVEEESLVHVLAHLVEDEPVSHRALSQVFLDSDDVLVLLEISVHS